jgi:hypothetical protein
MNTVTPVNTIFYHQQYSIRGLVAIARAVPLMLLQNSAANDEA